MWHIQDGCQPFKSGPSHCPSVEAKMYTLNNKKVIIDTPGIENPETRDNSIRSIVKAIRSIKYPGRMKIVFCTMLQAGRVRPTDAALIQSVLHETGIDISNCGIIINRLGRRLYERLQSNESEVSTLLSMLAGKRMELSNVLLLCREEELEDMDNAIIDIPGLVEFIHSLPSFKIPSNIDPFSLSNSFRSYRYNIENGITPNNQCEEIVREKLNGGKTRIKVTLENDHQKVNNHLYERLSLCHEVVSMFEGVLQNLLENGRIAINFCHSTSILKADDNTGFTVDIRNRENDFKNRFTKVIIEFLNNSRFQTIGNVSKKMKF